MPIAWNIQDEDIKASMENGLLSDFPQGLCGDCAEEDLYRLIRYLISHHASKSRKKSGPFVFPTVFASE